MSEYIDYAAAAVKKPDRITMITIHRRRPRGYWVRIWILRGGVSRPRRLEQRTSLKRSRELVPNGMVKSALTENDAPDLVEVWMRKVSP